MTLNLHLLDALAARDLVDEEAPLYGRVCETCGHLELSEDPLLVVTWRKCPSCTVRRPGNHGRT